VPYFQVPHWHGAAVAAAVAVAVAVAVAAEDTVEAADTTVMAPSFSVECTAVKA